MNWNNYFKDYNVKTAHSYLSDMVQLKTHSLWKKLLLPKKNF